MGTKIAASLLAADFAYIADAVKTAEDAGADWIHLDVMDGSFVPNMSFGPKMVGDIRKLTKLPLDVHLMIASPDRLALEFVAAGADHVTFHPEATVHTHRLLSGIKEAGAKPGLSIVPSTPVSVIDEMLPFADIVIVMTVNPGFGGQQLIPECLAKVSSLCRERETRRLAFEVSVDGGINRGTVSRVRNAGADVLISGTAFYGSEDPASEVELMRGAPSPKVEL